MLYLSSYLFIMKSKLELWQITYQWLNNCGNKISKNYIQEELTTHPDYPALVSVADFLDQGKFKYKAVQADSSYIDKFNYPLLAHINQPGQEHLQIINALNEWNEDINRFWSGIVLYPELNSKWENLQNSSYLKNSIKNIIILSLIIMFAVTLVSYISLIIQSSLLLFVFGILSVTGLAISIFLLGTELGYQNQVVKQVCGAVSDGGCEKVLKSNYAKGFKGITPADASIIYFFTQIIMYILSGYYRDYLSSILLVSFLGFLVALWSIYTQAIIIRQYCILCLGIGTVLIFQFLIVFYIYNGLVFNIQSYNPVIINGLLLHLVISLISIIILIPIKNLIKINKSNKLKIAELKKWKLDADLYINEWKKEQLVDISQWENDLILGNPEAPLLVTVACNLYCGPCSRTHKKLDELLSKHRDTVKIQIRLLCNLDEPRDIKTISVSKLLQKYLEIDNNLILQEMLNDWFEWMNLEKWASKWQIYSNSDVLEIIKQHSKWVHSHSITYTPTIFVNGRKMPSRYTIDDFELLIPQLLNNI